MRLRLVLSLLVLLVGTVPAFAKDGAPSRLFPYYDEDTGVLILGQVMHVGSRAEIVSSGPHYQFLLSTGIPDSDISDGRLVVLQLYCCGGRISEDQSIWAYVAPGLQVETNDFVEIRMGRVPRKQDPGTVNTVIAVRQRANDSSATCRWEPDNPSLWMRVIHCDGMEQQGWSQRGTLRKLWFLPAGAAPVSPSEQSPETANPQGQTPPVEVIGAAAAPDTDAVADACYLVDVNPQLQNAVREAAAKAVPPVAVRFPGESRAEACKFRLALEFTSTVDRSSQRRNQDGAVIGGPATLLLGAITPWSCPTTHRLTATLTSRSGESLGSYRAEALQKRVGTMLMCTEVEEPQDEIVTKLVGDVLGDVVAEPVRSPTDATSEELPTAETGR